MTRDQKQLAVWILGIAAALGIGNSNLHALLGCHCQLYPVEQLADWSTSYFAPGVGATNAGSIESISSQPPGGLVTGAECYACRVLSSVGFWPDDRSAGNSLNAGERGIRLPQLSRTLLELCEECLPRGPPLEISSRSSRVV